MSNTRQAVVPFGMSGTVETIERYLPGNYRVVGVLIEGEDNCGWTLDEYVLPRLASGLYFGREIDCQYPYSQVRSR